MDVQHGIGLFVVGMIVTVIFFVGWFHAMEQDEKNKNNGDKNEDN